MRWIPYFDFRRRPVRWGPYFAYGRRQLRIGVKRQPEPINRPWRWEYRFVGIEWQL